MIYVIGNRIKLSGKGLWNEGAPYSRREIYRKTAGKLPPVNYDEHSLKPHSLTHAESPLHTDNSGMSIDHYIRNHPEYFIGEALLLKFESTYTDIDQEGKLKIKVVTVEELRAKIGSLCNNRNIPGKILITTEDYPVNEDDYHDENSILVLDIEAAEYLTQIPGFHLFGTSWKSTDHQPGSFERPIHNTLFRKGIIFELLMLKNIPEGFYFFAGMPLFIEGANESPVTPVLIKKEALNTM